MTKYMNSSKGSASNPKALPAKEAKVGGKTVPIKTEGDKKGRGKSTMPLAPVKPNKAKGF